MYNFFVQLPIETEADNNSVAEIIKNGVLKDCRRGYRFTFLQTKKIALKKKFLDSALLF